jgi:hypothetical protein
LNEENSNISFDGLELVKEILDETPQFPCFILTSFDSEAVTQGEDVNIVYIKGFSINFSNSSSALDILLL